MNGGNAHSCPFWLLVVVLWVCMPLVPKPPPEEGGVRFGIDSRFNHQEEFEYLNNFHLDLWQNWLNVGRLTLWIDWNAGRTGDAMVNTLGRGFAALEGFRLARGAANGLAGDFSQRFTLLRDRFANASYPDLYLRGGQLQVEQRRWSISGFGGWITRPEGLLGTTFTPTHETVYGTSVLFHPSERFRLGSTLLASQDREGVPDGGISKGNQVLLVDTQWQAASWLNWLGEWRMSRNRSGSGGSENGQAFRIGPILDTRRLHLEFNYRKADPNFHFLSHMSYPEANQQGLFLLGSWQVFKGFRLNANYDRSRNTSATSTTRIDGERLHVGANVNLSRIASLALYFDDALRRTPPDSEYMEDYWSRSLFAELRLAVMRHGPFLRYQRIELENRLNPENDYLQQMATAGLRTSLSSRFQVYAEAEWQRRDLPASDQRYLLGKLGFYYYRHTVSAWGEVIYHLQDEGLSAGRSAYLSGSAGLSCPLFKSFSLYLDARYDRWTDSPYSTPMPDRFQVTLRLSNRLRWGEPASVAGLRGGAPARVFGSIEGRVFLDTNLDQKPDREERGFGEGVEIRLEDGTIARTDSSGNFRFPRVAPGVHVVSLNVRQIPVSFNILSSETQKVVVKMRERIQVSFAIVMSAAIRGRLVMDENGNGLADPGEKGLSDVLVYLDDGDINNYTNEAGEYAFQNLMPGTFRVRVDTTTLPANVIATSPVERTVTVSAGKLARAIDFMFQKKMKPVVIR